MANVTVVPQQITTSGLAPTYTGSLSTSNTYLIRNNGRVFLHVKNAAAGGDSVVTVETPATLGGQAVADLTKTIADGAEAMIGPFPTAIYNDVNGDIKVTYSEITGITHGAFVL